MKRVQIQHLEKFADILTKATGDRHYIEGCSGAWRLHRASDGQCLHHGSGAQLMERMRGYLYAHLDQFGSADPRSIMHRRKPR